MTPARMTQRMIVKTLIVCTALLYLADGALAEDVPSGLASRIERDKGQLILAPGFSAKLSVISAGSWARERIRLIRNGTPIWESPLLDFWVGAKETSNLYEKLLRIDLDGNGKPDWIYLTMSSGPFRAYGRPSDAIRIWPDDEAQRKILAEPWDPALCVGPSGLIVLDDEKTAYAFNYDDEPDPFAHSNPYVQGPNHFKRVVDGSYARTPYRLQTSSAIPEKILKALRVLLDEHSCNTPDRTMNNAVVALAERFNWQAKQQPFGTPHWRDNLAEGLAMYHRAQEVYAQRKQSMPKDELLTQNGLSVFRLDHFFETFAYDEIDPENKFADYTAMLNDYAFYLMAPQDAAEAVGFEQRRKPVDEGVLAMLAHVIRRDPKRSVAYLNLGDALWRNQRDAEAIAYYKKYAELIKVSNPKAKVPQRVLERSKAH